MSLPVERDSRTKVLHIATRFLDGGSEQRLVDAVKALPADRFSHYVVVGAEHDMSQLQSRLEGCEFRIEPHLRRDVNPVEDARALIGLTRFIRKMRFDVVHTCQSKSGILGRTAAKLAGTPTILHNLSMANFFESKSKFISTTFRGAERLTATWTNAYCVVGEDLKNRYAEAGIASPDRYHVIRSSIELDRFRLASKLDRGEARGALGLPQDEHVVCYVGSLNARKGVMQLPSYLQTLCASSDRPVRLVIAGEGELGNQLKVAFATAGLMDSVSILGYTRDVPNVMAASDCVVLLSEAEGLPQVLVQAAAVRRPFVSYAVDGTSELKRLGATGTVVHEGNAAAAARATLAYFDGACPAEIDLSEWDADHVRQSYRTLFAGQISNRHAAGVLDLAGGQC